MELGSKEMFMLFPTPLFTGKLLDLSACDRAEKGRMLMWPSYLPHAVEHGTANEDEDRIVVAFNVMIRGLVDQLTMRMDFK